MILVSIGANLPGRDGAPALETCRRAAAALDALPGLRLRGLSRWFATAPVLAEGDAGRQPDYVNGVAHLVLAPGAGAVAPAALLARLMELEAVAGRVRSVRNAPRVLDLDIIAMGDLVRTAPDPVLPHPRAHERGFVLVPLGEIVPGWVHPVLGRSVEALIAALPPQLVRPLSCGRERSGVERFGVARFGCEGLMRRL
ncbi:MAG TPA: 2-amino-4-hydroxy-6-hydroxymethyldihydropteridine diphosphokinase [Acetobacteraceae bacterium]|jgi:2-amino-4-hydroxy-6-hydroxymethyldihydropteridine diphosphokinase|nr:2-amino-4-hydroxy-6-hydroxymethyldihydropteridine diphosphokinase [Acetobacteraceae bacterium]HUN42886.1 2-amino-4-hydroxy-6-hydroxymethyldihydropteridine diphosphokinase [Acetobacteraceae bacterium]